MDLVKIVGIMNTKKSCQMLMHGKIPSANYRLGNSFMFQHENDPKHIVNTVKAHLDRKALGGTPVVDWAPQSPDPNISDAS